MNKNNVININCKQTEHKMSVRLLERGTIEIQFDKKNGEPIFRIETSIESAKILADTLNRIVRACNDDECTT